MWNGKRVAVVFPAFNEEESIYEAVVTFYATGIVDDVIVVNNNSTDHTVEEALKAHATLIHESKQGYGAALTRGLTEATGDYIILAEPDGTFSSTDIIKLLSYADDFDMVCGTRTTRELIWAEANMGWFLRLGNLLVAKWLEMLHNTCSLSDCGCTLRLIDREALQQFLPFLTVKGSHFLPEMVILARKCGLRIIEIPVNYRGRKGMSKITGSLKGTLTTGLHMIWLITAYRFKRTVPYEISARPNRRCPEKLDAEHNRQ